MVSLRFPFSSFPPPPSLPANSRRATIATVTATAALAAGIAITYKSNKQNHTNPIVEFILSHVPINNNNSSSLWASMSLTSQEPTTMVGVSFPSVIKDCQTLLGVGLRRKRILGLKNIDVYAFGVYADEDEVQKNLKERYGKLSTADLKDFSEDLLSSDLKLTVRLQIVYSKLSIRSVRSAFEESVGSRLQKFGGQDNKELLGRFTSQFKDELKIPKGSVIELSRENGHVLHTKIDGQEVGSIQSKLLCQSVLDLYIGEDPFDQKAKENMMLKLAQVFENKFAPVG